MVFFILLWSISISKLYTCSGLFSLAFFLEITILASEKMTPSKRFSRIYLDLIIVEAQEIGLIRLDAQGDTVLMDKGKMYAIQNDLIK